MTQETEELPDTTLRTPAEGYSGGFNDPNTDSYAELYNQLFTELFTRSARSPGSGEYEFLGSSGSGTDTKSKIGASYSLLNDSENAGGVVPVEPTGPPARTDAYYARLAGTVRVDTAGEDATIRLYDRTNATALTGTEVTIEDPSSGFVPFMTPRGQHDPGGPWVFAVQAKASTSGVEVFIAGNPTVLLYGSVV